MQLPRPPDPVDWSRVYQLQAEHFVRSDTRTELLAFLAAAVGEPWPWGSASTCSRRRDGACLRRAARYVARGYSRRAGSFRQPTACARSLPATGNVPGGSLSFHIVSESRDTTPAIRIGAISGTIRQHPSHRPNRLAPRECGASTRSGRLRRYSLVPDHPLRADASEALAGLAGARGRVHDDTQNARRGGTVRLRGALRQSRPCSYREWV